MITKFSKDKKKVLSESKSRQKSIKDNPKNKSQILKRKKRKLLEGWKICRQMNEFFLKKKNRNEKERSLKDFGREKERK